MRLFENLAVPQIGSDPDCARYDWHAQIGSAYLLHLPNGFVISAPLVMYAGFYPVHRHFGFHPRHVLPSVQQRLGLLEPAPRDLVVYLARGGKRSVRNEQQVLSTIRRGFRNPGER